MFLTRKTQVTFTPLPMEEEYEGEKENDRKSDTPTYDEPSELQVIVAPSPSSPSSSNHTTNEQKVNVYFQFLSQMVNQSPKYWDLPAADFLTYTLRNLKEHIAATFDIPIKHQLLYFVFYECEPPHQKPPHSVCPGLVQWTRRRFPLLFQYWRRRLVWEQPEKHKLDDSLVSVLGYRSVPSSAVAPRLSAFPSPFQDTLPLHPEPGCDPWRIGESDLRKHSLDLPLYRNDADSNTLSMIWLEAASFKVGVQVVVDSQDPTATETLNLDARLKDLVMLDSQYQRTFVSMRKNEDPYVNLSVLDFALIFLCQIICLVAIALRYGLDSSTSDQPKTKAYAFYISAIVMTACWIPYCTMSKYRPSLSHGFTWKLQILFLRLASYVLIIQLLGLLSLLLKESSAFIPLWGSLSGIFLGLNLFFNIRFSALEQRRKHCIDWIENDEFIDYSTWRTRQQHYYLQLTCADVKAMQCATWSQPWRVILKQWVLCKLV